MSECVDDLTSAALTSAIESKRACGPRIFDKSIALKTDEPNNATPDGMWSGCVDEPASAA